MDPLSGNGGAPQMVLQATGNHAWLPDSAGLGCLVVSLACLAHAPRALSRSRRAAGPGLPLGYRPPKPRIPMKELQRKHVRTGSSCASPKLVFDYEPHRTYAP